MQFIFKGNIFDTDKPVYIAGFEYGINRYWMPIDLSNLKNLKAFQRERRFAFTSKKAYIHELSFQPSEFIKEDRNPISRIKLWTPSHGLYWSEEGRDDLILGTSPHQISKILREKQII